MEECTGSTNRESEGRTASAASNPTLSATSSQLDSMTSSARHFSTANLLPYFRDPTGGPAGAARNNARGTPDSCIPCEFPRPWTWLSVCGRTTTRHHCASYLLGPRILFMDQSACLDGLDILDCEWRCHLNCRIFDYPPGLASDKKSQSSIEAVQPVVKHSAPGVESIKRIVGIHSSFLETTGTTALIAERKVQQRSPIFADGPSSFGSPSQTAKSDGNEYPNCCDQHDNN